MRMGLFYGIGATPGLHSAGHTSPQTSPVLDKSWLPCAASAARRRPAAVVKLQP